ncbi:hypothetical protein SAMN02745248_01001 [Hathewaya proteolytica DSM 3090]|uniref:Uncharacterized protein n=1 Tax=Hathewaya proteolytica DSM 3090 TaxID=1121331 RepID=A0A1M6MCH1_9CLOT|nr:hypothetical protein [Hathewaya proteolytica]SHJ81218.1 hypothetical protein SAMN02745248_01001 [Hathewaya proteolytica DSM 3090]
MGERIKRICCIATMVSVCFINVACDKNEQPVVYSDNNSKIQTENNGNTSVKSNEAKISDDDLKQAENVVTLKVTYKLETTKENVLTEPDGIHTKWTTLLKDEETNKWSILSHLGY